LFFDDGVRFWRARLGWFATRLGFGDLAGCGHLAVITYVKPSVDLLGELVDDEFTFWERGS
jgi:hypothetical protein